MPIAFVSGGLLSLSLSSRPTDGTERTPLLLPYQLSLTGSAPDAADAGRLGDAARDTRASAARAVGFRRSRWLFRVAAVASITFVASRCLGGKRKKGRGAAGICPPPKSWPRQRKVRPAREFRSIVISIQRAVESVCTLTLYACCCVLLAAFRLVTFQYRPGGSKRSSKHERQRPISIYLFEHQ